MRRSCRRLKQSRLLNGLPRPHFVRPRNDDICHAELVSVSQDEFSPEFLQLANSLRILPSPIGRGDKKTAFTLAEVLITLGIIGVVAALTIPNIISDYQEKRTVATLKKAYSTIFQAYLLAKNDYGDITEWEQPKADIFAKYIKNVKKCKTHCYPKKTLDLRGSAGSTSESLYDLIINDGTYIGFFWHYLRTDEADYILNSSNPEVEGNIAYTILVKTDSNDIARAGVNSFVFYIQKNKIVPYGTIGNHKELCDPTKDVGMPNSNWYNGLSCAGHVITYGNMDYMKCLRGKQKYCKVY